MPCNKRLKYLCWYCRRYIFIFKQGSIWSSVNNGFINTTSIFSIAIQGSNIFAGTDGAGIYLSRNNGTSWNVVGLPYTDADCLAISEENIFAGTWGYDGSIGGIYLSTDYGASWNSVGLINYDIECLATNGENIFAGTSGGIYLSSNHGTTWSFITYLGAGCITINGTNIYTADGRGVYLSSDNGANWIDRSNGLSDSIVETIAINGQNIFVGTYQGGAFLSSDNGTTWAAINNGFPNHISVRAFAFIGDNIFAGTDYDGVYLSTDNGSTWDAMNNGLNNTNINAFAISGTTIFTATDGGVFLSSDKGKSWIDINNKLPKTQIGQLVISNNYIYAGVFEGSVWKRALWEIIVGLNEIRGQKSIAEIKIIPNPAIKNTEISYLLQAKSNVLLEIYDIIGNRVETLLDEVKEKGEYNLRYNAENLNSGVYFVKALINNEVRQAKLIKE